MLQNSAKRVWLLSTGAGLPAGQQVSEHTSTAAICLSFPKGSVPGTRTSCANRLCLWDLKWWHVGRRHSDREGVRECPRLGSGLSSGLDFLGYVW